MSEEIEDLTATTIFLIILYISSFILLITLIIKIVRCLL